MTLKEILKKNNAFLIPVLIFISAGIVFLSIFQKEEIHLWINSKHSPFFDSFFKYITHLGDGWVFPAGIAILAFVKWRNVLGLIICSLITLLLIGSLKNFVFNDVPRPVKYFEGSQELRLVEGVTMNMMKSFPSGHTTAAFAFWGFIALVIRNPKLKFTFFCIGALAAYSRMYLSQHFLEDIVAGSILGTLICILSYSISSKWKKGVLDKKINLIKYGN